jgi:hypothetical protein
MKKAILPLLSCEVCWYVGGILANTHSRWWLLVSIPLCYVGGYLGVIALRQAREFNRPKVV